MKNNIIKYALLFIFVGGFAVGCNDFLEGEDSRVVTEDQLGNVLERTPQAYLLGIYSRMVTFSYHTTNHDDHGQKSIDLAIDLAGADMVHFYNNQWFSGNYWLFNGRAVSDRAERQWMYSYANINDANQILTSIPADTEDEKSRGILGECYALRAHNYFNLVNIYQTAGPWDLIKDKPGVVVVPSKSNSGFARVSVDSTYRQIENDLKMALQYLNTYDRKDRKDRIDINVVKALYARVALYMGKYDLALQMAGDVIDAFPTFMSVGDYQKGFNSITNKEWVWGATLTPDKKSYSSFFSMMDPFGAGYGGALAQYKCIDKRLYDLLTDNDVRKGCFGSADGTIPNNLRVVANDIRPKPSPYVQYKFYEAVPTYLLSDLVFIRVSEMYYIKAECEARSNQEEAAKTTLNLISKARAITGSHKYTWASGDELLKQISEHKRTEMWGEGQAGFEYNRLQIPIDRNYEGTNHPIKNISEGAGGDRIVPWGDNFRIIQIPQKEFSGNKNLNETRDQNPY